MTNQAVLYPRQPVPALDVRTLSGKTWRLADQSPEHFTLIVFYRGRHCPVCAGYLGDLHSKLGDFEKRGVTVFALSSDGDARARDAQDNWKLGNLDLGYGLALDVARQWGLYVSSGRGKTSIGIEEPALFSEPGLYLVRPDGTLYFGTVQTMPFARPHFDDILKAIDFAVAKDYPARGEIVDHHAAA